MFNVPSSRSGDEAEAVASVPVQPLNTDIAVERIPALVVTDLRKNFVSPNGDRIEVLRVVSFAVTRGESIAIWGASGAGKSTLLHLLGGVESADHGEVVIDNFSIQRATAARLARFRNLNVGFVFQSHHLLQDLTALENVAMPLLIKRLDLRKSTELAMDMLRQVGMDERAHHSVGSLSGGEQQRVAVCRALINQPQLVLADEPTGNLDEELGAQIADELLLYAQTRPAVVIIATHNAQLARRCNSILMLQEGRLKALS